MNELDIAAERVAFDAWWPKGKEYGQDAAWAGWCAARRTPAAPVAEAQPVYQVRSMLCTNAWYDCSSENLAEYQSSGHMVRTLYTAPVAQAPDSSRALYTPESWEVRDAALEEAVEAVLYMTEVPGDLMGSPCHDMQRRANLGIRIAQAIRALKSQPAAVGDSGKDGYGRSNDTMKMVCKKCGADRLKEPCKSGDQCVMMATAYDQRRFNREGV